MNAIHTLRARGNREKFALHDFELFVLILSALEWRKLGGKIKLVTDKIGAEYLNERGLLNTWNVVEIELDAMKSLAINENVFWAGAKIFALSLQEMPCVSMDLDFILWKPIDFTAYGKDLAVIHRENICAAVYPSRECFKFRNGWQLPSFLNWSVRPCNAAFVYFGSNLLVRKYSDFAIKFMQNADVEDDRLTYMVFAEQRWLAMCAKHFGIPVHEFSSLEELFSGNQKYFTHIWGYKQRLRNNPTEAEKLCRQCAARLEHDFPKFACELSDLAWAEKYFNHKVE